MVHTVWVIPVWHGCRYELQRHRLLSGGELVDGAVDEGGPPPRVVLQYAHQLPAPAPSLRRLGEQHVLAPGKEAGCVHGNSIGGKTSDS